MYIYIYILYIYIYQGWMNNAAEKYVKIKATSIQSVSMWSTVQHTTLHLSPVCSKLCINPAIFASWKIAKRLPDLFERLRNLHIENIMTRNRFKTHNVNWIDCWQQSVSADSTRDSTTFYLTFSRVILRTWIVYFEVRVMAVKNIFQRSSCHFHSPSNILVVPSKCPMMQVEKKTAPGVHLVCVWSGIKSVLLKT